MFHPAFSVCSRLTLLSACLFAASLDAQTHLVLDINPGAATSGGGVGVGNAVAILGSDAIFAAYDGTSVNLYRSDGTAAGTTMITVLDSVPTFSWPSELVTAGSRVFFAWGTSTTGSELWATDGTAAGTGLVKDIRPGTFSSSPNSLANIDDVLYFAAADAGANYELWRSDGTAAGTWMVKDIHTAPSTGSNPAAFAKLGTTGRFLFAATDATAGRELWVSDGTAAGTMLVKDIVPGAGGVLSSNPVCLTTFGSRVAFATLGELWLSDGTATGTVAVTSTAVSPRALAVQGGKLFFQGYDSVHGGEPWSSDGTAAGTAMIADINPGGVPAYSSLLFDVTPVGSSWVYFKASTPYGAELWRTNGSLIELFQDIRVGSSSSNPQANGYPTPDINSRFAVSPSGKMFFFADDGSHGLEPFVYDTGVLASSPSYGASCGGLSLSATTPYLGSTVVLTTSGIPAAALGSVNFLSLTKFLPPIDLTGLGMPGCFLHSGLDVATVMLGTGSATTTFVIPTSTIWLGFEVHSQSVSFVPGANAFGAITSNGITLVIGDL